MRRAARRDVIALLPSDEATPATPAAKRGQTFPRTARLVRKSEFDAVYSTGQRRSNAHFTVFVRANELPLSRFGFSIKKTLGGAVVRNRMRRRLREMVRCHREEIPAGWDIVIHPKRSIAKEPFAALAAELLRLLKSP
ncbi:MAG TPA: ribonuclease P protein component [Candidatus Eremiobacteraceae bacterium]|nr:ribonuclease P protein component [Candidatus Eremiobacteraceae bacterium]